MTSHLESVSRLTDQAAGAILTSYALTVYLTAAAFITAAIGHSNCVQSFQAFGLAAAPEFAWRCGDAPEPIPRCQTTGQPVASCSCLSLLCLKPFVPPEAYTKGRTEVHKEWSDFSWAKWRPTQGLDPPPESGLRLWSRASPEIKDDRKRNACLQAYTKGQALFKVY